MTSLGDRDFEIGRRVPNACMSVKNKNKGLIFYISSISCAKMEDNKSSISLAR